MISTKWIRILVLFVLALPHLTFARTSSGLTYIKKEGDRAKLIRVTDNNKEVRYTLSSNGCWAFSTDGMYFAVSDQQRSDLTIHKMSSLEIVYQEPYRPEWRTCSMGWQQQPDYSVLDINRSDDQNKVLHYRLVGNQLALVDFTPMSPQYPELPDWLKGTADGYILPSPDSSIVLYEKCEGLQTNRSGNSCAARTDFVIYDIQHQMVKAVLQNINPLLIQGSIVPPFDVANGAAWSATGRFLAYPDLFKRPFNLTIYDLETEQYLDTNFSSVEIDWGNALQWSPNGDKLALWFIGSTDETDPLFYRSPVFYDTKSQSFVIAQDGGFDIQASLIGTWSSDGNTFAFVDRNDSLYTVKASNGNVTFIDSGVLRILEWK